MTVEMGSLLFGDFDGDGRTDVFTQRGREWFVSWGGASPWEKINESDARMTDFAIGDFDDDHRADVFYADGQTWFVSSGGVTPFTALNTSSHRISDLRFGDFNGDGKTDVFSVVSGQWMVSYGGTSGWQRLRAKLTDSVANLTVADFDGDGRADVVVTHSVHAPKTSGLVWDISHNGTGDWTRLRSAVVPLASATAMDGTECRWQRPADAQLHKEQYSGKKRIYTDKYGILEPIPVGHRQPITEPLREPIGIGS
jgi:hypothetical protein